MDDPGLAWPAWKFGMRRDAIYTSLHDRYNTYQSPIQDPDAFQHDVHEIASEAGSIPEFHRLLSQRRERRLNELNESLESASFEIIANPMLIGTNQWGHALQLFRSRSLDSLVRYFASYLPSDHQWFQPSLQGQDADGEGFSQHDPEHIPPSPHSIATCSDDMHTFDSLDTVTTYATESSEAEQTCVDEQETNKFNKKAVLDTKTIVDDDDCSSLSSGPETPDSMSDADPDVAVTDGEDAHLAHHVNHSIAEAAMASKPAPVTTPCTATKTTEAAEAAEATTTKVTPPPPQTTPKTRHRTRCSSSMPSPLPILLPVSDSIHACEHSLSPSRPSPPVRANAVDGDSNAGQGNQCGRGAAGRRYRTRLACDNNTLSHSPARRSRRRRPGAGVEKTPAPLPRPMRTRLRERREAAAAALQRD